MVGEPQISLIQCRRNLIAAIQLALGCGELNFVRCCALKQPGKIAWLYFQFKVIINDFIKKKVLMLHSWHQSKSTIILKLRIF